MSSKPPTGKASGSGRVVSEIQAMAGVLRKGDDELQDAGWERKPDDTWVFHGTGWRWEASMVRQTTRIDGGKVAFPHRDLTVHMLGALPGVEVYRETLSLADIKPPRPSYMYWVIDKLNNLSLLTKCILAFTGAEIDTKNMNRRALKFRWDDWAYEATAIKTDDASSMLGIKALEGNWGITITNLLKSVSVGVVGVAGSRIRLSPDYSNYGGEGDVVIDTANCDMFMFALKEAMTREGLDEEVFGSAQGFYEAYLDQVPRARVCYRSASYRD